MEILIIVFLIFGLVIKKIKSTNIKDFVILNDIISSAMYDIRYYSSYNFIGKRIDGYEEPLAIITKEAACALKKVNDELITKGYCLKIYDAYRPVKAVNHFIKWSKDINDTKMKKYFYPELDKLDIINKGYIAKKSSHSRGSTVDLTIVDINTKKEIDMGGTFDYFGELSHTNYKKLTNIQYKNRMLLKNTMIKYGFKSIDTEWWHFTLKNEPFKNTYFNFSISRKSIKSK